MRTLASQWKEFEKTDLWKDAKEFILMQLSYVRDDLEDNFPNDTRDVAHDRDTYNKGRAYELRFLSELPGNMITALEAEMTENKEEEETNE